VFVRSQRKGIWRKLKLLSIIKAEEEVSNHRGSIVNDFDGLYVFPAELNNLRFD